MAPKTLRFSIIALFLIAFSIAIIYYLITARFYATGVFWDGAVTGVSGCLFLSSLGLAILLILGKHLFGSGNRWVFWMLVLSGAVTAVLLFFKPGDSDVWWYGAIAGFFTCLSIILLVGAAFVAYKLIKN